MHPGAVEKYLTELRKGEFFAGENVPHSFAYLRRYYRRHAARKRIWFRTCSVTVIATSALLPVVAAFGNQMPIPVSKDLLLGIMSAVVALFAGLLAHFKWEVAWRGQNEALFALEALQAEWAAAVAAAHASANEAQALASLMAAVQRFQSGTYQVVHAEMGEFFKVQQAPSAKPS